MRRAIVYALSGLLIVSPAFAAEGQGPMQEFEDAAKAAADRIVEVLSGLIGAIPQYEAPEILENGDIIIRRKQKPEADEERPPPRVKNTSGETEL